MLRFGPLCPRKRKSLLRCGMSVLCQLRTLALPAEVEHWSLTILREKLVKIGAKVVRHCDRLTDALGAADDQVDTTGQSLLCGIHPVCPAF